MQLWRPRSQAVWLQRVPATCWLLWIFGASIGASIPVGHLNIEKIQPNSTAEAEYTLNATHHIVLIFRNLHNLKTANPFLIRTWSSTNDNSSVLPVLVVAQQRRQVTAWTVPLLVEPQQQLQQQQQRQRTEIEATELVPQSIFFHNVSRIMCHDFMREIVVGEFSTLPLPISQSFVVGLSTSSPSIVRVRLGLEEQREFFLRRETPLKMSVSVSEPKYAFYRFDSQTADTVIIQAEADDGQLDSCLTLSLQDAQCPVFDTYKDIKYEGVHQTINVRGAITIRRSDFASGGGFFVVVVGHPLEGDCAQSSALPSPVSTSGAPLMNSVAMQPRLVTVTVKNGLAWKQYALAAWGTLAVLASLAVTLVLAQMALHRRIGTVAKQKIHDAEDNSNGGVSNDSSRRADEEYYYYTRLSLEDVTKLLRLEKLCVSAVARHPRRIKQRSYNYLSHTLSIALFYSIPVVQLVVTYQRIVNQTGNEDMCYYNFLCAHPALGFSDFNHIYSNIGYVIFGVVFILVVMDRHRVIKYRKDKGIPVHYGLFHAMGVALVIEGLLSACYHICPSQSNYQFDTSFMYVMCVLCMIKLYQNRHPDVNATAYTTFTVLGAVIFMATVGILNGSLSVWVVFVVCYSALCVGVSLKIYFLNHVLQGLRQFKETVQKEGFRSSEAYKPIRKVRFCLLLCANLVNYAMLVTGLFLYSRNITDFGTFLLGLLMANGLIHAAFYTAIKLCSGERVCVEATVYGLMAVGSWSTAAVFFLDPATLWTVTPAESRQWNQPCILLDFYDKHDVWHLISAPALYFTFMFLLCLDDDVINKHQKEIPVF